MLELELGLLLLDHKRRDLFVALSSSPRRSQHHVHTPRPLDVFWPAWSHVFWHGHSPTIIHVLG